MESNVWFYTLSTVAQVMAAVAGLFAVFVVFKLDKIRKDIDELRRKIVGRTSGGNKLGDLNGSVINKAKEFIKLQKEKGLPENIDLSPGLTISFEEGIDLFEKLLKNEDMIIEKLKNVLLFSIIFILILVFSLGLTQYLINSFLLYLQLASSGLILTYIGCSIYEISRS